MVCGTSLIRESCTLYMNTACEMIGHQVGERDGCKSEAICHQAH